MKFVKYVFKCLQEVFYSYSAKDYGFKGSIKDLIVAIIFTLLLMLTYFMFYLLCRKHFTKCLRHIMTVVFTIATLAMLALFIIAIEGVFNL